MKTIFEYFERIHTTSGRNRKLELVEELVAQQELLPTLTEVLQHTYDPYITFGVTAVEPKTHSLHETISEDELPAHWERSKEVLRRLANRELTGRAAQQAVEEILQPLPVNYRKWWVRIINRNLKISGVAANSWGKYIAGLTNNIKPQLCDKFDNRTIQEPMYVEPKYDGIRAVFVPQENGRVLAFSREGKPLFNTERLCELVAGSDNDKIVLDGELFYRDFHTTQSITSTQTEHSDAGKLQFFVFDAIPLDDWNAQLSTIPLFRRKEVLRAVVDDINGFERPPKPTPDEIKVRLEKAAQQIKVTGVQIPPELEEPVDDPTWPVQFVPCKLIGTNAAAEAFYRKCVEAGYEGLILKEYAAPYIFKRSKTWMKMKPSHDADLEIIGAYEGDDRLVGSLGGIVVKGSVTYNSRPYKIQSNVGSGFTDKQRAQLWEEHQRSELVGRIAEINFQEPDIDGALRFPVFKRLRDDRAEAADEAA